MAITAMGSLGENTLNSAVVVGASSVQVLEPMEHTVFSICNVSTAGQVIWLAFGMHAAVVGSGVKLGVGQAWVESDSEGFRSYRGTIQAIADAAGGAVAIMAR